MPKYVERGKSFLRSSQITERFGKIRFSWNNDSCHVNLFWLLIYCIRRKKTWHCCLFVCKKLSFCWNQPKNNSCSLAGIKVISNTDQAQSICLFTQMIAKGLTSIKYYEVLYNYCGKPEQCLTLTFEDACFNAHCTKIVKCVSCCWERIIKKKNKTEKQDSIIIVSNRSPKCRPIILSQI